MPLPPLGHTLLTQPLLVDGGVFIPDLARRMHELPPPSVLLYVAGEGAQDVADQLRRRGRLAEVKDNDPETREDLASRPRWRLWKPDPWVEHIIGVGSALDVGCGSGRDAVALASSGWQVVAADPLPVRSSAAETWKRDTATAPPSTGAMPYRTKSSTSSCSSVADAPNSLSPPESESPLVGACCSSAERAYSRTSNRWTP